jgi:hypothetical protein
MTPTARRSASSFLYFDTPHAWAGSPPHRQTLPGTDAPAFIHSGRRGARRLWPYPSRSMLGIVLLLGLSLGAAAWNARPQLPAAAPPGIDLLAAVDSPKVNSTSAERPPAPPAAPFATPIPKVEPPVRTPEVEPQPPALPALPALPASPLPAPPPPVVEPVAEAAPVPPPPPVVKAPPVEEPVMPPPPAVLEPGSLAQSCFRETLTGETPMKRTWNVLKVSSLLAAAVALTPLPAPAGPTEVGDNDLKQLKDSIDVLNKSLTKLIDNTNNGFAGVRIDLDKMRDEIKGLNKDVQNLTKDNYETKLQLQAALGTIKDLEKQVVALKVEMDKLQTKEKISLYKPEQGWDELKARLTQIETNLNRLAEGRTSFSPPAGVGRIQLVNQYPQRILFVINGKTYGVDPFTTVNLDNQPAGSFKYEVFADGYGMLRTSTPLLEPGKTYTITVR